MPRNLNHPVNKAGEFLSGSTFVLTSEEGGYDRQGDIVVVSKSAIKLDNFLKNPIALWMHDHDDPIGVWENLRVEGKRLLGDLRLAEKGTSPEIDLMHGLLSQGILKAVSIGFKAIAYEAIYENDAFKGYKFTEWELLEASIVSIPANPQALAVAKSLGISEQRFNKFTGSGSTANNTRPAPKTGTTATTNTKGNKMTLAEQIKAAKEKLALALETQKSVMAKSCDEGRTLDDGEAAQYDEAAAVIKSLKTHIERLEEMQSNDAAGATPVGNVVSIKGASAARQGVTVSVKDNLAPGQEFARYAKCLAMAQGDPWRAEQIATKQFPDNPRIHNVLKAAVAAGTTTGTTWAAPLVDYQDFAGDFLTFLRPMTILGKFGQNGIPALRSVPFNIKIKGQTSGGGAGWVGEGKAKPVTKFDFNEVNLGWAKLAAICVLSDELIRFSSPSADMLVRDSLAEALVARKDQDFIDPAKAAVAGVSPASITNGVTAVTASGTDEAAVRADVKAIMTKFIDAKLSLSQGVWVMHPSMALTLAMMTNALGQPAFPGITMTGGVFFGMPVIPSEHVASTTIVLTSASDIYLAEDAVMIDASKEASIEMSDAPTGDASTPTGATSLVSMWQSNSTAIRVEQYTNWQKRRNAAAQLITGAAYVA